ncbi:hypothetical protein FO519_002234 [Halicephalobus sp. NKZ332]|nr:hypothetical protein FO519_002234 [Halicephalobus sp. NKZ332]
MNALLFLLFLGSVCVFQLSAAPVTSDSAADSRTDTDSLVLISSLQNLTQLLDQKDIRSYTQILRYCLNVSTSDCEQAGYNWASQLRVKDVGIFLVWDREQKLQNEIVKQKIIMMLSDLNIPPAIKADFRDIKQILTNPSFAGSAIELFNSLSRSDQAQLKQVFQQVYGINIVDFMRNVQRNQNSNPYYAMFAQKPVIVASVLSYSN